MAQLYQRRLLRRYIATLSPSIGYRPIYNATEASKRWSTQCEGLGQSHLEVGRQDFYADLFRLRPRAALKARPGRGRIIDDNRDRIGYSRDGNELDKYDGVTSMDELAHCICRSVFGDGRYSKVGLSRYPRGLGFER